MSEFSMFEGPYGLAFPSRRHRMGAPRKRRADARSLTQSP